MKNAKPATLPAPVARLIEAAKVAKTFDPHLPHSGDDLAMLTRAIPFARSLVLFGDPLDHTEEPAEHFIAREEERWMTDARRDSARLADPEDEKAVANAAAYYFLGLAVGLLLAERV